MTIGYNECYSFKTLTFTAKVHGSTLTYTRAHSRTHKRAYTHRTHKHTRAYSSTLAHARTHMHTVHIHTTHTRARSHARTHTDTRRTRDKLPVRGRDVMPVLTSELTAMALTGELTAMALTGDCDGTYG